MFGFRYLLPFIIFLGRLQAFPLVARDDIAQDKLDRLSFISQYAGAAYCRENNVPASDPNITCSPGNCPLVQSAGATSIAEFQNIGLADATGFVALDHTSKLIVISFRGSMSLRNLLSNFNIILKPWDICSWCFVHSGFFDSWKSVKPTIKTALDKARAEYPQYTTVATGHSLGAALATLAAADLRNEGYPMELYSYAGPMVGSYALANFITNQGKNYRVTHQYDPIPKLPGYLLGYAHISDEYWIKSDIGVAVTTKDIAVSSGAINFNGSSGILESVAADHGAYFGRISACNDGSFEF